MSGAPVAGPGCAANGRARRRARQRRAARRLAACAAACAFVAVAAFGSPACAGPPQLSYQLNCQGCHLADGRETPGLVPGLAGSVGRYARLAQGRAYLIRLPNIAAAPLTDAELAELLTWLVRRFDALELPPDFAPFTADEVARSRRAPLVDVEAARQAVLDELARAAAAPAAAKTGS